LYSVRARSRRCFVSQVRVAERAMNHLEKLFVIKRLNQESDCADLHREDPRGNIFVSCDHDRMSPHDYPKMNLTGDKRNHRWLRCAAKANTLADVFTLFGSSRNRFNPVTGLELPA
jgi:hypothetical protein